MKHISKYFSAFAGLVFSAASVLCVSGCEDKIVPDGPKDLYEVIVNKPVVRIGQNETVEVKIILGNEDYSVKSYDTEIAGASVSGDMVTITSGSRNGATTVTVTDGEGVSADISVNVGLFELELSSDGLSMEPDETRNITVSMGNFSSNDELDITVADEKVAKIVNTDPLRPYYEVTALGVGSTDITFRDTKGKTAILNVTVNPFEIIVSNLLPRVGIGGVLTVEIEQGNGGYSVESSDEGIVLAEMDGDGLFRLTGVSEGTAAVTVTDGMQQSLTLNATVVNATNAANLGSGNYFSVPFTIDGAVDESLDGLNAITFESRINISSLNGDDNACINTVMGVEKIFLLRVDVHKDGNKEDRYLQLSADDNGGIRYEGSTRIETDTWYDVAVVLDGSKSGQERIALYVNGTKETLQLTNGNPDELRDVDLASNFYIGRSDGKRPLNGAVTFARIWTKALTDTEIAANAGKTVPESKENLAANWIFTDVSDNASTFVSSAGSPYEAIANSPVTSWLADPALSPQE